MQPHGKEGLIGAPRPGISSALNSDASQVSSTSVCPTSAFSSANASGDINPTAHVTAIAINIAARQLLLSSPSSRMEVYYA